MQQTTELAQLRPGTAARNEATTEKERSMSELNCTCGPGHAMVGHYRECPLTPARDSVSTEAQSAVRSEGAMVRESCRHGYIGYCEDCFLRDQIDALQAELAALKEEYEARCLELDIVEDQR